MLWRVRDLLGTRSRPDAVVGCVCYVGVRDSSRALSGLRVINLGENFGETSHPALCVRPRGQTEAASLSLVRPHSFFFFLIKGKSRVPATPREGPL